MLAVGDTPQRPERPDYRGQAVDKYPLFVRRWIRGSPAPSGLRGQPVRRWEAASPSFTRLGQAKLQRIFEYAPGRSFSCPQLYCKFRMLGRSSGSDQRSFCGGFAMGWGAGWGAAPTLPGQAWDAAGIVCLGERKRRPSPTGLRFRAKQFVGVPDPSSLADQGELGAVAEPHAVAQLARVRPRGVAP